MSGGIRITQETLDLPVAENEPKPWIVRTWRYHAYSDEYFLTKEDAYDSCYWRIMADMDEWVEGIFDPDGNFVERPDTY